MGKFMTTWTPIPGETPIDPSGLRPRLRKLIHTRRELNPVEAENIRIAVVKYLADVPSDKKAPFTGPWALKLHKEMFGKVWLWAGRIRTIELNLGSPAWRVQEDLYNLFEALHCWKTPDMPLVEQAATLHYRAVKIHPFENGNGRWARLLTNIWLRQRQHEIVRWPETNLFDGTSQIRTEYIHCLKQADQYNLQPLIDLHKRYVERL